MIEEFTYRRGSLIQGNADTSSKKKIGPDGTGAMLVYKWTGKMDGDEPVFEIYEE